MRYSQILGDCFYQIQLTSPQKDMVDVFFTAAGHHFHMLKSAESPDAKQFHLTRHRAHLRELMMIVYRFGDFSKAVDPGLRSLDNREGWNPDANFSLPEPRMFDSIAPDAGCGPGEAHPSDWYISKLNRETPPPTLMN